MSTITVAQEIESARERVTPFFEALREDMTAHFWEAFGAAAAAYRGARSEGPAADRFAGVVGELIRDAKGTASNPELRRGADVPEEYPLPAAERQPWATMPTDGSGRLTVAERVVYILTGAAVAAVLLILGFLISGYGDAREIPATPLTVTGAPAGAGEPDRDAARELIIEGAWLSWQAYTECGEGPAQCDAVLREVNANPYGVHFFEDGSAVDPARN